MKVILLHFAQSYQHSYLCCQSNILLSITDLRANKKIKQNFLCKIHLWKKKLINALYICQQVWP